MIISKLRKPFTVDVLFAPYSPFVWAADVSFEAYTQPTIYDVADFDFTQPTLNDTPIEIAQVYINNVQYESVSTLVLCQEQEQSYYFDFTSQKLYVHAIHSLRLDAASFDGAKTAGYCSDSVFYDSNDVEYLPYMSGSFSLSEEIDRLVYDKMSFVTNTVEYDNQDGEFDQYIDNPTPGSDVNILYISQEDLDSGSKALTPIYTGYAESDSINLNSYSVSMQDKRAQLNVNAPSEIFDSTTYTLANDKTLGKTIPDGYGNLIGAAAYCINGTVETGDVLYKYGQVGTTLDAVYTKVSGEWIEVTPTATDTANCTFTLSDTDGRSSSGKALVCKVDARLRDIDNPSDQIVDMIERYVGRRYIPEYYDTTQWAAESAYLADTAISLEGSDPLFEQIERLQNGSDYGFRFFINAEGKYSLKVDDIYRATSHEFTAIDNISDVTQADRDFTQYATEVRVNYNTDIEAETGSYVIDDTYKDTALDEYRYSSSKEYDSLLTNQTDAEHKAELIAIDYSVARSLISFTLDDLYPIEYYDIITVDTSVYRKLVKIREYYGVRKLKVAGYEYDFETEQTTITGYDITEVS